MMSKIRKQTNKQFYSSISVLAETRSRIANIKVNNNITNYSTTFCLCRDGFRWRCVACCESYGSIWFL